MQWISVENFLPGYDLDGFLIVRCSNNMKEIIYLSAFFESPEWIFFEARYTEKEPNSEETRVKVTHWMIPDEIKEVDNL